ncbi:hypothetical protein CKAN_01747400 [Cinnamomum micranthum f. kanehirae]|uniref:Uncharacterized protein n=1 Tax=Cinnamomum micranthum f. kanehirae TaxID=337451 RepID=A0A3S3MRM4_9MAGN|nr:hypothetical protein CKAN_01747300 [Cinnamomum micranthum f. kanehirae]RWR88464.1 hypothetical protein CKAN_01747400 [Cinnamomum micranthum f. kanehirae]
MNRRVRSPIKASSKREERLRLQKYLKPGALAQLRDSRMHSRTLKRDLQIPISPSSASPATDLLAHIAAIDGLPFLAARIYGPRFPQRKKLVAVKSVFMLRSSESAESLLDLSNNDIVVAH